MAYLLLLKIYVLEKKAIEHLRSNFLNLYLYKIEKTKAL